MKDEEKRVGFNQGERVLIAVLIALVVFIGIPLFRGVIVTDNVAVVMVFAIIGGLIGFIIQQVSNNRTHRERIKAQTQFINQMMNKFDSPEAFISFLESPVGQRVFDGIFRDGQIGRKPIHNAVSGFLEDREAVSNTV